MSCVGKYIKTAAPVGVRVEAGQVRLSNSSPTTVMPMSAPPEIIALVERFEEHHEVYTSASYNETQLRDDFLNPFFVALGWDVDNTSGYAEAYRDVVKEEALRTEDGVKAPDFTFRIGGVRKFFVEAKRPSVPIGRHSPAAYQLRRYAWSAKLPLSLLTNFAEFSVYDTRTRPEKTDSVSKARVFHCNYKDLVEKWDWLYSVFSKEAILKGSFDKYVDDNKAKRGTSEVDADFLRVIEGWRSELAQNLAIRNPTLTNRELNFAVQRIIDRIIFLRICEDRGIEDYGRLGAIAKKPNVYAALGNLFVAADAKYNSGIFHFKKERGRAEGPDELTLNLKIDDVVLRHIFSSLYYPESPFAFEVISADILGQVYEQFLGKVISLNSRHRAIIEDKPAVRKAGGVYYTPSYVVDYMVQKALGPKLAGKSPKQIANLKVLDPACGSGSFLIVAYQYLLDWYLDFYVRNDPAKWTKGKRAPLVQTARSGLRLTLDERRRILLTHIFGVDIDDQAVEVTKLSLLLKVLEGESEQTIQPYLSIFQERALPDLERNIKCGNSLIGPDFYADSALDFEGLEPEKINAFDWSGPEGYPDIMADGGFDVILGNPPYIFTRDHITRVETSYFSTHYKLAWEKHNTYLLFMELLLKLLSKNGAGTYIVPNSWLTIESGKLLREAFIDRLELVVDLNYQVFNKVAMEPSVFVVNGRALKAPAEALSASSKAAFFMGEVAKVDRSKWRDNGGRITTSTFGAAQDLLDVIRAAAGNIGSSFDVLTGLQAYEQGKGTPPQTAADVANHVFDARTKVDATAHPYLQGRDVLRYRLNWSGDYLRYGPWLSQPRDFSMFSRPRVLLREITSPLPYCLSASFSDAIYLNNKSILNIFHAKDDRVALKSLSGILNSKLMSAFYKAYAVKGARKIFPKVVIRNLREFPYPKQPKRKLLEELARLSDQMVSAHERLDGATTPHAQEVQRRQINAYQVRIDELVYELYGVDAVGIAAIEKGILAASEPATMRAAGTA